MPVIAAVVAAWVALPLVNEALPKDVLVDGTVAILGALLLFVLPDGSGRPILTWAEANRAPWDVIMLFGGGLALGEVMARTGDDRGGISRRATLDDLPEPANDSAPLRRGHLLVHPGGRA